MKRILSGKWLASAGDGAAPDAGNASTRRAPDSASPAVSDTASGFSSSPFGDAVPLDTEGPRILILDDEISVRRVCTFALRGLGWRPEGEGSARSALARIRNGEKFDVIVLDYAMPDMNGLEFLNELQALPETVARPAILMASAHADGAVAKSAMLLGVWDFLAKPLMPDDIRRRTRRLINREARAAEGNPVAAALLKARRCEWSAALAELENVETPPAPLLRGLFQEMRGDEEAAQQEYARAYWSAGWSEQDSDLWPELSRRLDIGN